MSQRHASRWITPKAVIVRAAVSQPVKHPLDRESITVVQRTRAQNACYSTHR